MQNAKFFSDDAIRFDVVGPSLSEQQIISRLPNDFAGKNIFLKFYTKNNGGYIHGGAYFYRDVYFEIKECDFNSMEVESFYFIPPVSGEIFHGLRSAIRVRELREKHSENIKLFCSTHFPFAGDAGDNDYWIEYGSGRVQYIHWESVFSSNWKLNVIDIAPSFDGFCNKILSKRRINLLKTQDSRLG